MVQSAYHAWTKGMAGTTGNGSHMSTTADQWVQNKKRELGRKFVTYNMWCIRSMRKIDALITPHNAQKYGISPADLTKLQVMQQPIKDQWVEDICNRKKKNEGTISPVLHAQCLRAKWFLNLSLTERNMQVKFDLKLSVHS